MSKYCLKAVIKDLKEVKQDNKTVYSFKVSYFELYKDGKFVKKTKKLETKRIMNNLKSQNIKLRREDDYMILNQKFINDYVTKPISKKGLTGLGTLSSVGLIVLTGIYNMNQEKPEEYEQTILPLEQTIDNNDIKPIINEVPKQEETEYEEADELYEIEEDNLITYDDLSDYSICSFDYEDRSDNGIRENVENLYGASIDKYASMYGVDSNIVVAIISQENPNFKKNNSSSGAYGLMQVENIWNNKDLTCYNLDEGCYETITVDTSLVNTDADYSIKVGCMILASTAETINKKGLNDSETLEATLIAYNKGITVVNKTLNNTSSYDEFKDVITSTSGGDNDYVNHVLSFLPDETIIHMQCVGKDYYVATDNQTVKGYTI